jgi:hypothetical protein
VKYLRGVKSLHCQRAAELLEQLHSTPEPVAWMYKDEAYFNGKEWRENWEVTTSERLAVWKSAPEQPVPLYALPLPALENEK